MTWNPLIALLRRTPPLGFLAAGLMMAFHPTLLAGLDQIQVFPNDSVFNQIVLEHGWMWVSGQAYDGFWNAPFGYPMPNLMATCDLFLSFGPLYWIWRALHIEPLAAFSLWMFSVSAANFAVCYLMLRRCCGATVLGSSVGAFVFAFASARMGHLNTQQLLPHFYLVLVVWGVWRVFDPRVPRRWRVAWLYLAPAALAAQFYGGFYNGYFMVIYLALALVWALALGRARRRLLQTARSLWLHGLLGGGLAAAVVAPLAWRYLEISKTAGERSMNLGLDALPRWQSWFYMGQHNWLYGGMARMDLFAFLPVTNEHILGLGFVTTAAVAAGLWWWRRQPGVLLLALVSLTCVALFTMYSPDLHLWDQLYAIPGMRAIRLPSRIGLLLQIPAAVGLAAMLGNRAGWRRWAAGAVALLCCVEQGTTTDSYSRMVLHREVSSIAERIEPHASAFMLLPPDGALLTEFTEHRAMWAALRSRVPCINFTTGAVPMSWPFDQYFQPKPAGFNNADILRTLEGWLKKHSIPASRVQIIEFAQGGFLKNRRTRPFLIPPSRCPGPPDLCPEHHRGQPPPGPAAPGPAPPGQPPHHPPPPLDR